MTRCGVCVHRNALLDAPSGYCTPMGWRKADDPPCAWGFGHEQLRAALYGRALFQPKKTKTQGDLFS